jgi:hypothetical protein
MKFNSITPIALMLLVTFMTMKNANAQAIIAGDKFFCLAYAISVNDGKPTSFSNAKPLILEYNHPFLSAKYLNSPQTKVTMDQAVFQSNFIEIDEGNKIKVTRFLRRSNNSQDAVSIFLSPKMELSMTVKYSDSKGVVSDFSQCEIIKNSK